MDQKEHDHSSHHHEEHTKEEMDQETVEQHRHMHGDLHTDAGREGQESPFVEAGGHMDETPQHEAMDKAIPGRDVDHDTIDHVAMGHGAESGHAAHVDHSGHEQMFRQRFWISLLLSIPVLLYSATVQQLLGFSMPSFPGSQWIEPVFAVIVFLYGGIPFLQMAVPELRNRQPGMMTLISLAISVAFIYSVAAMFIPGAGDPDRYYAPGSLAGDAQRAPGVRRAQ
jgi:Cu2+-exporting ATPase